MSIQSKKPRKLQAHYGRWLNGFRWTHWGTFTLSGRWTSRKQLRMAFGRFLRRVGGLAQSAVPWFMVIETGAGGRTHIHALLEIPDGFGDVDLAAAWIEGRVEVEPFDPHRGASYYLAKCVLDEDAEYDISKKARRV
jgi:hypothetical protein